MLNDELITIAVIFAGLLLFIVLLFASKKYLPTTCREEVVFEPDSGVNFDFRVKPRKILVCE